METEFGIKVCFSQQGGWSKQYTYKSAVPYKRGDIVLVPTNHFYNVAKVTQCVDNYDFDASITYKSILKKVEI